MKKVLYILIAALIAFGAYEATNTKKAINTNKNLSVHFIDVGQADSILVMLPSKENMLIDAGNNDDGEEVVKYLKSQNIKKIDYLVGTHPHEDHIGGLDTVINAFKIGKVYMPKVTHTSKTYEDVLYALKSKGLKVISAKAGVNIISLDNLNIDILAPCEDKYEELNNYSAVIKLTYYNNKFLFMGDAEALVEKQITADVSANVLKVSHHGSNTSSSKDFLEKVSPHIAVISVGKNNDYNHPHKTILDRLKGVKAKVLRTDNSGTIVIESDGENISIK